MLTVPSAGSADVWWLDITSVSVGRAELAELSLEEHKRAAAFAFRADRRRYTAAHVMLRRVLSGLDSHQAIDLLMSQLRKTKTNYEFLVQVSKTTPGSNSDNDY